METTIRISGEMQVNEIIRRFPATVAIFRDYGIDSCCGGALPVGEAAVRHGHDAGQVLEELNRVAAADQ